MNRCQGFTLIEMAVAVFIVGLLAGSILVPLVTQSESRRIGETEVMLSEVRDALVGFAAANRHLPCPDKTTVAGVGTANDGEEDVTGGGACVVTAGNLPAATLGLRHDDPWGNRLRYRVVAAYAQRGPPVTALATPATLRVCTIAACCNTNGCLQILTTKFNTLVPVPGDEAVAVIMSLGPNGYGAISYHTGVSGPAPTSADELANVGAGASVFRVRTQVASGAGEFDDIVVWLGRPMLFKHMVAAGQLP